MDTHQIVHHCITNIFNQAAKSIRILDVVEKTFNFALLHQRLEFLENLFQFPDNPCWLD